MDKGKKLSREYPPEIRSFIILDGGNENNFDEAYRVSRTGEINREAFLGSFLDPWKNRDEEICKGLQHGVRGIGNFSTSFFSKKKSGKKVLKLIENYGWGPRLLKGCILPSFGLSMMTKDSKYGRGVGRDKSHIDLWLYEGVDPSACFEFEAEEN